MIGQFNSNNFVHHWHLYSEMLRMLTLHNTKM